MNEQALKQITCALKVEIEVQHRKRQLISVTKNTDS